MKIDQDLKLDFKDVLIRPKRTTMYSRSQVDLEREFKFPHSKQSWKGVPVITANMDNVGTFELYEILHKHKILTCFHKFYTKQDFLDAGFNVKNTIFDPNYYIISTGIQKNDFNNLCEICDTINVKFICIDVANGYMEKFMDYCIKVRERFPNKIIIAGNVVSREMTEELIIRGGVDIVKVGIGSGSVCTTRIKTGVGMPQLSAVMECADAAHGVGGYIISDGGIQCPGDMSKAYGGGADFTMAGGIFAGHYENPGETVTEDGIDYKKFYGMSSKVAMKSHYGKINNYRASEGKIVKIKIKGHLQDTINDYLGGIRSTCTYINAKCIKNIPKCTTFVLVNRQVNQMFNN